MWGQILGTLLGGAKDSSSNTLSGIQANNPSAAKISRSSGGGLGGWIGSLLGSNTDDEPRSFTKNPVVDKKQKLGNTFGETA